MAYCSKCGFQNPDEATFCSKCGGSLKVPMTSRDREWDNKCEDECAGGKRGASIFWGIFVILIGVGILIWVLGESSIELPQWVQDLDIWVWIGALIAIAIIVTGVAMIFRRMKPR